jgi:L-iditol 2-dehydrogenase
MKAAFLTGKQKIDIRDIPAPEPGEGEALVRVKNVGICGSDVHYYLRGRIGGQIIKYPFIIGHEAAGVVEKVGKGVTDLREGTGVALEPGITCGFCSACRKGMPNLCSEVKFLGSPPVEGVFREYAVMPFENLFPLGGVSTEEGALVEPLGVGFYAVRLAAPLPGDTVAVFGCGPIGISLIIFSRLAGAERVIAVEKIRERAEFAKNIGADYAIIPGEASPVDEIMRLTGGKGADISYEAAGDEDALVQCAESAGLRGKVIIVGIPEEDFWRVPSHNSRRKELVLMNVRRSAFTPEKIIPLLSRGRIEAKKMITHRFGLEEIEKAMNLAAEYSDGVVKAMIEI